MSWEFTAPLVAIALTVAVAQVAVVVANFIRTNDYRRFESRSASRIEAEYPLPTISSSLAEDRRSSLAAPVEAAHKSANVAQTSYHDAVVRSAACLGLGFISIAVGMLSSDDWPSGLRIWLPQIDLVLSWLDTVALLSVLVLFRVGTAAYPVWIKRRTNSELLRQFQYLTMLFPSALRENIDNLVGEFQAAATIPTRDEKTIGIEAEIARFWLAQRRKIETAVLTADDLQADALLIYLGKRARRQIIWFSDSMERLEHVAERRKRVLMILYSLTAVLALSEHISFLLRSKVFSFLHPLLLAITGISVALTASYVNQNSRSLIHRYYTQVRESRQWMDDFRARLDLSAISQRVTDCVGKDDLRTKILRFEDMMIAELVDWIHISSRDVIELA